MDLISRQAAIDAIDKALSRTFIEPCGEMILKAVPSVQSDFSELLVICDNCGHAIHIKRTDAKPTIEPERKPGRWTHAWESDDNIWKCSECGFEIDAHGCVDPVEYLETFKFCPNCGSDNREEGDRDA